MNTAGLGDDRHSNIISLTGDGNYVLGFQKATFGSWYLAIYPFDSSTGMAGESIWNAFVPQPNEYWVQVPGTPSLIFSEDGNLEMWSRGQLQWSLALEGLGVTHLEFNLRNQLKSVAGNLVLYNKRNHVVWQSKPREEGKNDFNDTENKLSYYTEFTPEFVFTLQPEGLQCSPCMGENPSPGDVRYRNIFSHTEDGKYAFGFEKARRGYYLAIYKFYPSNNSAGRSIWRAKSKGGGLVRADYGATLTLRQGIIEVRNSRGRLVWTRGTRGFGYWYQFYFNTGNLMLISDTDAVVWESSYSNGYGN
ncbi:hypothetical protein R1flu_004614 [Riccia fluitans]|uniref:Bulb-type lectin domain-containing protein n=1 Tax=Riccia fluitans TaxID=41844 RepID=A0ABD1YR69_9MARC